MKIDITSMFFNSKIEGQTATPAWGTSIGQSKQTDCRIETSVFGVTEMLVGMTYKMKTDLSKLDRSKMSNNREVMMCSVFDKVYANNELLEGLTYTLLLVKEHSESHPNRLIVSYAPHLSYDGKSNQLAIDGIRKKIGCGENGCWFVHDISIVNQDELHFNSVVVDKDQPKIYRCKSQERSKEWKDLIPISNGSLKMNSTQASFLTAIRTKPFLLLAGISGTGKSRIVRKLAQATDKIDTFSTDADRWKCHSPQNFCLIQVKPNWHNSMDVVGFKSNIGKEGEHYEYTPFVEFIAKAWKHEDVPFFLCLDEMNLAPVEEYFAEFLSAIESRSNHNGSYETDPIIKPFREFGEKVAIEMIDHLLGEKMANLDDDSQLSHVGWRFLNQGLTLPKNLIVMGTVNMDETTFSFSRKVLDRAMSIEMNEVSYDDFLSGKTEEDIPVLETLNDKLVERPISAQKVKDADSATVIEYLKSVNSILDGTPFKLGYRAANEAILYIAAAKTFGSNDIGAALDDFTLMKILSRIEGDDSKLKTKDGKELLNTMFDFLNTHFGEEAATKSQVKLKQMIDILERDHFVSFWG